MTTEVKKLPRKKRTPAEATTFAWEIIETQSHPLFTHFTRRAKVPGGYLIQTFAEKPNLTAIISTCFFPTTKVWNLKPIVMPEPQPAPQAQAA